MNEHARASELLPWMVNGRIEASEARWLNDHLEHCAACRSELVAQRRIRDALTREPTVEFAPQASFNRLWKRIEAEAAGMTPQAPQAAAASPGAHPLVTPIRSGRSRWVRATLAAQAAAILVLCGVLWLRPDSSAYRTVTDAAPAPGANGTVIKAIFSDQVRLTDLKEILAGAGLVVASGPSEAGVYALVPRDASSHSVVPAAVARLRADPRVRFAEVGAQ
jgi:hypothetical protein